MTSTSAKARLRARIPGRRVNTAALYTITRLAQQGTMFVTALIVARALGPAGRAQFALALAIAATIWGLLHLSLDRAAVRLIARQEATVETMSRFLAAATVVIVPVGVSVAIVVGLAVRDGWLAGANSLTIALAAATIAPLVIVQMTEALLLALGRLTVCGLAGAAGALLTLLGIGAAEFAGKLTVAAATAATLAGSALAALALLGVLAGTLGVRALRPGASRALTRKALRAGRGLHPGTLGLQLGTRVDLLVVGATVSATAAGQYSLALTLGTTAYAIGYYLSHVVLRVQTFSPEEEATDHTVVFARRMFLVGLGLWVVVSACAYPFITLVYGSEWAASVIPLVLLAFATLAYTFSTPLQTLLTRVARPRLVSAVAIGGLLANVLLTLLLASTLGIIGAAAASVVAYWGYALAMKRAFERVTDTPVHLLPSRLRLH